MYHRESRKGRYQLTYKEAKAVCKFEGGSVATYDQLEAARQIGLYYYFLQMIIGATNKIYLKKEKYFNFILQLFKIKTT